MIKKVHVKTGDTVIVVSTTTRARRARSLRFPRKREK